MSRSAVSRAGSLGTTQNPPEGVEGTRPPSVHSNAKFVNSDDVYAMRDTFHVPASTPVASVLDINKLSETEGGDHDSGQPRPTGSQPGSGAPSLNGRTEIPTAGDHSNSPADREMELTSVTGESVEMMEGRGGEGGEEAVAGGNDGGSLAIVISLEEADGTVKTVDLEEEEERRATESSSIHSDADEAAEKFKESQAKKQAELDQLLQEHQQIVSQIEELEKIKEGEDIRGEEV